MKLKRFLGFTLAEILIAFGILGIIAVLILPPFIQHQNEKANVNRLKKVYATLSEAYLFAKAEYGPSDSWDIVDNNQNSTRKIFSYFEPYLSITKKCDNKAGCWASSTKSLSGQTARWSDKNKMGIDSYGFILRDGIYATMDLFRGSTGILGLTCGAEVMSDPYVAFYVDVNGNKKPNVVGRDIFIFAVGKDRIIPAGEANNSANCNKNMNNDTSGYGCTYKVLLEGKINY